MDPDAIPLSAPIFDLARVHAAAVGGPDGLLAFLVAIRDRLAGG